MRRVAGIAMKLLSDPAVRKLRDEIYTIAPSSIVRRLNRPGPINRLLSPLLAAALDSPWAILQVDHGARWTAPLGSQSRF